MIQENIVVRYAKAFIDIAQRDNKLNEYKCELERIDKVMTTHKELEILITHPNLSMDKKLALLDKVLSICSISEATKEFIKLLHKRNRISMLSDIYTAYTQMIDIQKQIITVKVISAIPLNDKYQQALKDKLAKFVSPRKLKLDIQVMPEILGGLIIKINDTVIDGSIKGRLLKLWETLVNIKYDEKRTI
jgi:F-type H+-transporting ATPase subunit delta